MSFKKVVAVSVIAFLSAATSYATTVTHTLTISGEYNGTTGALITTNAATAQADALAGVANVYRININSILVGKGASQAYGGELFDLTLSGGLSRSPNAVGTGAKTNYIGSSPALPAGAQDANGTPVSGTVLGTDADSGVSNSDWLAITTVLNTNAVGGLYDGSFSQISDPRTTYGDAPGGATPGVAYVKWDGATLGTLTFGNSTYINYNYTIAEDGTSSGQLETTPISTVGASITFVPVPEPATMVLMGLGGLGLVGFARRRRS